MFLKMNSRSIPWDEKCSPSGRYHLFQKDISLALGGKKDLGPEQGGHPFDLALIKIPPKASNWPLHVHTTQWELFVIVSGYGEVTVDKEKFPAESGDCFLQAPGTAHQITNTGEEDFVYYIIANNPPADISYYPHSDKWFFKPQRKTFKMQEVDYFLGEE